MTPEEKVRENYCRRQAKRIGFYLKKSRAKKLNLDNWGQYQIIEPYRNLLIAGERYEMSLEDVEKFLNEREASLFANR